MGFLKPSPPPYDPTSWARLPFTERARVVCTAWAVQGYGAPAGAYLLYVFKTAFYVGMWS
ncbi:MAG: DUF3556 domain-containing protein, partial [Spirochaetia bacterium]|nr:DUF3556 domain-containing protein [Spirochaetia bacterium]